MISNAQIRAMIPHSGPMCLLDHVVKWDSESIECEAINHQDPRHPLAVAGKLGCLAAVEYGAQAIAVHGGLTAALSASDGSSASDSDSAHRPRVGFLASVRDVQCSVETLHQFTQPLKITAIQQMAEATRAIYDFEVHAGPVLCAKGRAAIVIDAGEQG
jgi:predicted hotdog family 3-hydroxylacyl-ACP dehydratase